MINDLRAEADVDAICGVGEEVSAQGTEYSLCDSHPHQQGAKHIEAAEIALADHGIDDLLD